MWLFFANIWHICNIMIIEKYNTHNTYRALSLVEVCDLWVFSSLALVPPYFGGPKAGVLLEILPPRTHLNNSCDIINVSNYWHVSGPPVQFWALRTPSNSATGRNTLLPSCCSLSIIYVPIISLKNISTNLWQDLSYLYILQFLLTQNWNIIPHKSAWETETVGCYWVFL